MSELERALLRIGVNPPYRGDAHWQAGLAQQLLTVANRLERLEAVVEASREIRRKYPGGKMLWFHEFDAFEKALAALDQGEEQARWVKA